MRFLTNCILSIINTIIIVSFLVAPLSFNPNLGKAFAFSVGEEREVGEKLLSIVRQEFKLLDDPDIAQYINDLGKEILTTAGPQYFNFHFFVINNKEFNAFAAPSGLIFVHSGLIDICDNEDELVSVLAHEVGHVASRHIANRMEKSSKLNIGTAALLIAGIALGGGALSEALIAGSQAAGAQMQLKFSRQDEEEADRLAFKWMEAEHRDPAEMVEMLQKMRRISRYRSGMVPAYLLTHPEPERRINYISDLLTLDSQKHYKKRDDFDFQRIRYRVQVLTRDSAALLPIYLRHLEDKGTPEEEKLFTHFGLSQIYLANRDYEKARESLNILLAHFPNKPILKTDIGITYFQNGEYTQALNFFKAAMNADPNCLYTTYYYAQALQKTGSLASALTLYEKLLAELPDYSKLYYNIGEVKAAQGDNEAGHYYLGVFFWLEGDVKAAKFHLHQVIQKLPKGNATRIMAEKKLEEIERLENI